MKMMETDESTTFQSSEEEDEVDSDEELQAAFARGDLKPGLVVLEKPGGDKTTEKPLVINNVPMLEMKLKKIKLPKKFNWVERLDIVNGPAPLAPELALQMDDHKTKREREIKHINAQRAKKKSGGQSSMKSVDEDPVHNDFLRETNFYRQAQEAILKCLPKLKELGVPTKRPDDYFAEMAKSDSHMQKVAKVLNKRQIATEKAEKVRKIREQKKFAKQTQVHVLQEKQKAKKEFMENVKKYRKCQKNNLDFLEERKGGGRGGGGQQGGKGNKPMVNRRREGKNEKYGYGGKKKGSKWNTRESLDSFDNAGPGGKKKGGRVVGGRSGFPQKGGRVGGGRSGFPQKGGRGGVGAPRGNSKFSNKGRGGGGGGMKRPGKGSRQKIKARKN